MPVVPAGVTADGTSRVWYVPTIANPNAPSVAELNAASAADISCLLAAEGWATTTEQAAATDTRWCSKEDFEAPGRVTNTADLTYVYSPQGIGTLAVNRAYTVLVPGSSGYIVERLGLDVDTAPAAAQRVDVWPVTMGVRRRVAPEANSTLKVMQKPFVTGPVVRDVALVA